LRDDNNAINVAKSGKDDKRLFDVFVSVSDLKHDRLLIEVTEKQDSMTFQDRIKESLELRYDYLNGLNGLRLKNIRVHNP